MDSIIEADLYRYTRKKNFSSLIKAIVKIPGFRVLYFFRICTTYPRFSFMGIFAKICYHIFSVRYGIQIPKSVKIGKGFIIRHYSCIVINSQVSIGNNCEILQGVTIGQTNRGKLKGAPTIGDKVYIAPGAVVVGKITVGNNVLIAPNAYVNFDVPDNCIVIGNPGKIIYNDEATVGYIENLEY